MAGDIFTSHPLRTHRTDDRSQFLRARFRKFAHHELSKYKRVLYIRGNHEPYQEVFEDANPLLREFLAEHAPNTRLLDNETELIQVDGDEIAVLGTTLWAPCAAGTADEHRMINALNDFQVIRTGTGDDQRRFLPSDANALHQAACLWLGEELPKHKRAIVMTHHAPSFLSSASHLFHNSPDWLDAAYCSNMVDLIQANPHIEVWCHGHTHRNVDYHIDATRIIANHRGYFPDERISRQFNPAAADFDLQANESEK